MLGPTLQKMPDKNVCSYCNAVRSKVVGGTKIFPRRRTVNYCNHPDLETEVSFIKGFPITPKWCPCLDTAQANNADEADGVQEAFLDIDLDSLHPDTRKLLED